MGWRTRRISASSQQFPVKHRDFSFAVARSGGSNSGSRFGPALLLQQTAQRAQVIQDPAARLEVVRELLQVVEDQAQGLQLFGVGSAVEIGVHGLLGFEHSLVQQLQIFLGAFDTVEGSLFFIANSLPFSLSYALLCP